MATVKAQYDGRVFVPFEHVGVPVGATVEVLIPESRSVLTPEQQQEWQEILKELAASDPPFPTVEEAMRITRGRP